MIQIGSSILIELLVSYFLNHNQLIYFIRETNENNLLLKEMCESMKSKLMRAEQKIVDMARLEIENEVSCTHSFHYSKL